jgi:hypothetical protein
VSPSLRSVLEAKLVEAVAATVIQAATRRYLAVSRLPERLEVPLGVTAAPAGPSRAPTAAEKVTWGAAEIPSGAVAGTDDAPELGPATAAAEGLDAAGGEDGGRQRHERNAARTEAPAEGPLGAEAGADGALEARRAQVRRLRATRLGVYALKRGWATARARPSQLVEVLRLADRTDGLSAGEASFGSDSGSTGGEHGGGGAGAADLGGPGRSPTLRSPDRRRLGVSPHARALAEALKDREIHIAMLTRQLEAAGIVPITEVVSLAAAEESLKRAYEKLMAGDSVAAAQVELLGTWRSLMTRVIGQ